MVQTIFVSKYETLCLGRPSGANGGRGQKPEVSVLAVAVPLLEGELLRRLVLIEVRLLLEVSVGLSLLGLAQVKN